MRTHILTKCVAPDLFTPIHVGFCPDHDKLVTIATRFATLLMETVPKLRTKGDYFLQTTLRDTIHQATVIAIVNVHTNEEYMSYRIMSEDELK